VDEKGRPPTGERNQPQCHAPVARPRHFENLQFLNTQQHNTAKQGGFFPEELQV
jgi:hypothetical protein